MLVFKQLELEFLKSFTNFRIEFQQNQMHFFATLHGLNAKYGRRIECIQRALAARHTVDE